VHPSRFSGCVASRTNCVRSADASTSQTTCVIPALTDKALLGIGCGMDGRLFDRTNGPRLSGVNYMVAPGSELRRASGSTLGGSTAGALLDWRSNGRTV
jgi:hypothetical protein